MRFARSVIAQFYGRGKSLGSRHFCSSRRKYTEKNNPLMEPLNYKKEVEEAMKMGDKELAFFVMKDVLRNCVGLATGSAFAYLIVGSELGEAEQIEKIWKEQVRLLDEYEERLERELKYYGITSAKSSSSS